jgi:hypothetical protein
VKQENSFLEIESSRLKSFVVRASEGQIWRNLDDEAVILDSNSGKYYGLNEVGVRIWELSQEPKSVLDIQNTLLTEYDVEPDRCERELLVLLQELADNGLIEVKGESDT